MIDLQALLVRNFLVPVVAAYSLRSVNQYLELARLLCNCVSLYLEAETLESCDALSVVCSIVLGPRFLLEVRYCRKVHSL